MPKRPLIWILGVWILGEIVAYVCGISLFSKSEYERAFGDKLPSEIIAEGKVKYLKSGTSEKAVLGSCCLYISGRAYECGDIIWYLGDSSAECGQTVRIQGSIQEISPPDNPGEFDARTYYKVRGIDYSMRKAEVLSVQEADWPDIYGLAGRCHTLISETIDRLAEDEAGFEKAVVLGDKSDLDDNLSGAFRVGGISHVLAVSGLHLSLIASGLLKILKKLRLPLVVSGGLAAGTLLFYVIMIDGGASAWRAFIMFAVQLFATLLGRSYDLLSSLAVSGMVLLIVQPAYVLDSGFQLSFAAIAAIGIIYPRLETAFFPVKYKKRIGDDPFAVKVMEIFNTALSGLIMSLSIQFATFPLVFSSYFTAAPYGVLLNIFVIPIMGIVLSSFLIGSIVGICAPTLGTICMGAGHYLYMTIEDLAVGTSRLPGASVVTGCPSGWQIMVYYFLLAIVVGLLEYYAGKGKRRIETDEIKSLKRARICALAALALPFILIHRDIGEPSVTALYVGQGDCSVITVDGFTAMIDCGSQEKSDVAGSVILPYIKYRGISNIDMLLLTHADKDHISGVAGILSDPAVSVDKLAIPYATADDAAWREVKSAAEESGCSITLLSEGDIVRAPGTAGSFRVIYPPKQVDIEQGNDTSLTMLFTYNDFSALFPGDISSEIESQLIGKLPEITYLKVAHHGSKNSSSQTFLSKVHPTVAVISAGRNNMYGHPAFETIDRLEEAGARVFNTQECGAVTTLFKNTDEIKIKKEKL